jgi:hypothetical protein
MSCARGDSLEVLAAACNLAPASRSPPPPAGVSGRSGEFEDPSGRLPRQDPGVQVLRRKGVEGGGAGPSRGVSRGRGARATMNGSCEMIFGLACGASRRRATCLQMLSRRGPILAT